MFGTRHSAASVQYNTRVGLSVAGSVVYRLPMQWNCSIGVTLDSALTFDKHTTNVVRACTYHMRALRHLRPLLSTDDANMNRLCHRWCQTGLPQQTAFPTVAQLETLTNYTTIQKVQNQLARVVLQLPWSATCHGNPTSAVRLHFSVCDSSCPISASNCALPEVEIWRRI